MFDERVQIRVSPEQQRWLKTAARDRGTSIGQLVRDAIDAYYGVPTRGDRIRAVEWFKAGHAGSFLTVREMDRIIDEDRHAEYKHLLDRSHRDPRPRRSTRR